jgi:hypothetical protein
LQQHRPKDSPKESKPNMATTTVPPPLNGKQAKRQRFFRITFHVEGTDYTVIPLTDIDPAVAVKAYRMVYADQGGNKIAYDISWRAEGFIECECLGFLRWSRCKHIQTLIAAGMLPATNHGRD